MMTNLDNFEWLKYDHEHAFDLYEGNALYGTIAALDQFAPAMEWKAFYYPNTGDTVSNTLLSEEQARAWLIEKVKEGLTPHTKKP